MYRSFFKIPPREREALRRALQLIGGDPVVADKLSCLQDELSAWANGTPDGGMANQGRYPITMADGTVVTIPSLSKLMEEIEAIEPPSDPGDLTLMFDNKLV